MDNGMDLMSAYIMGNADSNCNRGGMGNIGELAELLVIAGLFGGGGWGFGGGFGGGGAAGMLNGIATRADINEGFALQNITSGIQGINNGLCDGFHNMTVSMMGGFNGVSSALCNLQHNMDQCCCTTQRAIDGVNYNISSQFAALNNNLCGISRDIIDNQNNNYRALFDFMVNEKLSAKDATIVQLQNQLSQANQSNVIRAAIDASTAEIIRRTGHDYPTASYLVQPPTAINFPTNGCGQVQFGGYNGNCGNSCCGYAA